MMKESINGNLYVECVSKVPFYWKLKIKQIPERQTWEKFKNISIDCSAEIWLTFCVIHAMESWIKWYYCLQYIVITTIFGHNFLVSHEEKIIS